MAAGAMIQRRSLLLAGGAIALAAGCSASADEVPTAQEAGQFVLERADNFTQIAQLTGPGAVNDTESVLLAGADLGSMFTVDETTWFVFGDNFGLRDADAFGGEGDIWKSNALAFSTDDDPTDGITFDGWILDESGTVKEVLPGQHDSNDGYGEVTKIPTQGWGVDESLFLAYMSVKQWGDPGQWWANHAGIAVSTDQGQEWEIIEGLQWEGESNFVQLAQHVVIEDDQEYLYLWGIPAGRFGSVKLMRVPNTADAVRDKSSYSYYAGQDGETPRWSDQEADAQVVLDRPVGELSVLWSHHLERWLLTTMIDNGSAVVFEGLSPWGPWSEPHVLTTQAETPGLYAPYMNPRYVSDDGTRIYITFSIWGPYQVFWYSFDLTRAGG